MTEYPWIFGEAIDVELSQARELAYSPNRETENRLREYFRTLARHPDDLHRVGGVLFSPLTESGEGSSVRATIRDFDVNRSGWERRWTFLPSVVWAGTEDQRKAVERDRPWCWEECATLARCANFGTLKLTLRFLAAAQRHCCELYPGRAGRLALRHWHSMQWSGRATG